MDSSDFSRWKQKGRNVRHRKLPSAIEHWPRSVQAVETVDAQFTCICKALREKGGSWLITADRGNTDQMIDPATRGDLRILIANNSLVIQSAAKDLLLSLPLPLFLLFFLSFPPGNLLRGRRLQPQCPLRNDPSCFIKGDDFNRTDNATKQTEL